MDIGLSSLISSLANAMFGTGAVIAQNQYNSPISQLRRLRKAGLPQAYMYQGKVNQQTQVPQLSLEPTLGQAKKLELSQQNEMNQANIRRIAEEILDIQEDVNLKKQEGFRRNIENERNQRKLNWEKSFNWTIGEDGFPKGVPNDITLLELDKKTKQAEEMIRRNEGRIRKITADVEDVLWDSNVQVGTKKEALRKMSQQITNMVAQAGLLNQMKDMREFQAGLNKTMFENMQNKGELAQTIMWFIMQFTGKFSF